MLATSFSTSPVVRVRGITALTKLISLLILYGVVGIVLAQTPPSSSSTTYFAYDAMGNLTMVSDPLSNVTRYTYDPLNRLITGMDAHRGIFRFGYNGQDKLTSATDPRTLSTRYQRDGLGNETARISPDTGTTQRQFDEAGNLISNTDAKGQTTTYAYDVLNRPTQIYYADGQTVTFQYDHGTNAIGRLNQFTDSSGTTTYRYDPYGRIVQEVRTINNINHTTSYTYDNVGQLANMTYPGGRQLIYLRDALGRVQQIVSLYNNIAVTLVRDVHYAPTGKVLSYVNGTGNTLRYTTDLDGRTISYSLNQQRRALTYDAGSRLITQTDPAQTVNYGYDNLNRLTSAIDLRTTSTHYAYDAVGNRTTMDRGGASTRYSYSDRSNQLTQISGAHTKDIQSDANGSITDNVDNKFSYDSRGRLVAAQTAVGIVKYQLNAFGQRVSKVTANETTVFHYDQAGKLIGEQKGAKTTDYIYLNTIPVAVATSDTAQLFYISADHLNTPRLITDETGKTVWRWEGEAFGNIPPNENPFSTGTLHFNLRFPGQYFDAETNLFYNYFRDYDPATGRYIESDPVGLGSGINTYDYVGGNPLSYFDPFGLRPLTDSEKGYLAPYIPARDLNNADIHVGEMPGYAPSWAAGITRGNDIYFRDSNQTFDTPNGIGLLGHELVHVGQYADGMTWFSYLLASRNGYKKNPYEIEAYKIRDKIEEELRKEYGDLCPVK